MTTTASPTLSLWARMFGNHTGYLSIASGTRVPGKKELDGFKREAYAYPHAASFAEGRLLQYADQGKETYFCGHLLTDTRCVKENAARMSAAYVDGDGARPPAGFEPTIEVESSPGRSHFYWGLTADVEPAVGEEINRRLAYLMGADKSGWDLTQLLRPIGTPNHKHDGAPLTRLVHDSGPVYNPDELLAALPPVPGGGSASRERSQPAGGLALAAEADIEEPPLPLSDYALSVWRGERPTLKLDGGVDRSESLFHIGAELADAGLARRLIPGELAQRDQALGWNRYTNRPEEYARIARKLAARGPKPPDARIIFDGISGFETVGEPNAATARQVAALEKERDQLRARLARNLRRRWKERRQSNDFRRRCTYLAELHTRMMLVLGKADISPQARIIASKVAAEMEHQATAGKILPGGRVKVAYSEPKPTTEEESRRAGYSLAVRAGCSPRSISRAVDGFVEMGVLDRFVDDAEFRDGQWSRDAFLLIPEASGGHPGIELLQRVIEHRPATRENEAKPARKVLRCLTHPEAPISVLHTCTVDGEELRRREYVPPPVPTSTSGQNVASVVDVDLIRQNVASSSVEWDTPTVVNEPIPFQRTLRFQTSATSARPSPQPRAAVCAGCHDAPAAPEHLCRHCQADLDASPLWAASGDGGDA